MPAHPTLDRLNGLKLNGMAEALAEMDGQDGTAHLTHAAVAAEDLDYKARRGLDKALFQQLLTSMWIRDERKLMIAGPCGMGKTWLACALARAPCREGVTLLHKRVPRLFDDLEIAHADRRFPRLFGSLTKTQLLIPDD